MSGTMKTFCRNCTSICGMIAEVQNNEIISLKGDREHPLTEGYMCIKGQLSKDWQNGDDRITNTYAKNSAGELVQIEFDQALDELSSKLTEIIEAHGVESVATYYGTGINNNSVGHAAMKSWAHAIGSPYVFSSMTLDQSAKWITFGRMGAFVTGKRNITDADVIMAVGSNPMISHSTSAIPMTNPGKWIREAKSRGSKLIVVDPRLTETAKRADIHVAIRPGEDTHFFAGLIRIVIEKGWYDKAFCDQFVDGFEDLKRAVSKFTPELVSARTGISEEQLLEVAETFATTDRKSVHSSTGPNMAPNPNTSEHLLEALNAICGGYRRAGDEVPNLKVLNGFAITQEMVFPPYRSWEHGPKLKSTDIGPMFGEYPTALLPHEILNEGEKKIRALICVGGNPLKALPDPDLASKAFSELDLLVTLDPRKTDTTEASDYVFGTSLPYERFDFTGMGDLFISRSYANATKPIVEKPDGVCDDWEVFWGLCQRMGKPFEIKLNGFAVTHADTPGPVLECDMAEKPSTREIVEWMCSQGDTNFEELEAAPQGILFDNLKATITAADPDGPKMHVCPPDVANEVSEIFNSNQVASKYKLIVRRMLESMNSAYSNASGTRRRYPYNPAFMHPDDMSDEGISSGDKIEIATEYGTVIAHAKSDSSLQRGLLSITHAWGTLKKDDDRDGEKGANIAALISGSENLAPMNYMPVLSGFPVSVTPISTE